MAVRRQREEPNSPHSNHTTERPGELVAVGCIKAQASSCRFFHQNQLRKDSNAGSLGDRTMVEQQQDWTDHTPSSLLAPQCLEAAEDTAWAPLRLGARRPPLLAWSTEKVPPQALCSVPSAVPGCPRHGPAAPSLMPSPHTHASSLTQLSAFSSSGLVTCFLLNS